ncbi:cilia- and flagella-associated protein 410-like [Haliotis rubra]|uniref:cilia- and flagella-associated protein 410-like n=1 Tax=Haliotis rubra TaxID=36100 RepID=UPI001EE52272|nr:cilia- and flagella-associated protein 410-like [Haliotis rubra]
MALTEKYTGKLTEALVLARTRATDLDSVCKLNCWGSSIKDVSIVRQMPSLEVCSLSVNEVDTLRDFAHCPNLQELYIRKNNVKCLTDIQYLKKLPKLRVLWLSENPCAAGENYRMTVLKTLPNLQKLDNKAVTEEEINLALDEGEDLHTLPLTPPATQPIKSLLSDQPLQKLEVVEVNQPASKPTEPVHTDSQLENGDARGDAAHVDEVAAAGTVTQQTESGDYNDADKPLDRVTTTRQDVQETDSPRDSVNTAASQGDTQCVESSRDKVKEEAVTLSWEETNRIREQLGLKPLPKAKIITPRSSSTSLTKSRNANILQSVLLLVRELDRDSLEVVHSAIKTRMEAL